MMGILINLEKINKSFLDGKIIRNVLVDLDFSINESEFVTIRGKSGSGKTTLLSIIGMFLAATSGKIIFKENDISLLSTKQRNKLRLKNIGFVFQAHDLFNDLTVEENVQLPLTGMRINRREAKQRSLEILNEVDMQDRIKSYPNELSGGEQQRVGIARAMVMDPALLLADEPTRSLDQENETKILNLLKCLNKLKKSAICIVSHDISCQNLVDRSYVLSNGKLTLEYPK